MHLRHISYQNLTRVCEKYSNLCLCISSLNASFTLTYSNGHFNIKYEKEKIRIQLKTAFEILLEAFETNINDLSEI